MDWDNVPVYDNIEEAHQNAEQLYAKYGASCLSNLWIEMWEACIDPPIMELCCGNFKTSREYVYETVKKLIELGADVNASNKRGTPMQRTQLPEIKELLLEHGAELPLKHRDGSDILQHWCELSGREILLYLKCGADPFKMDGAGGHILHRCRDIHVAQKLLEIGMDINVRDILDRTPLHTQWTNQMIIEEDCPVYQFLIENGADVNATDIFGRTPLHTAQGNPFKAERLIQAGADVNAADKYGCTPLNQTVRVDGDRCPCDYCSDNGWLERDYCKLLIENGADINTRDEAGNSPLHKVRHTETAKYFVDLGNDINARDNEGNTPLHKACNALITEALIQMGADVNARNNEGMTPLHLSHSVEQQNVLLKNGADIHARDEQGRTVMQMLTQYDREIRSNPEGFDAIGIMQAGHFQYAGWFEHDFIKLAHDDEMREKYLEMVQKDYRAKRLMLTEDILKSYLYPTAQNVVDNLVQHGADISKSTDHDTLNKSS